ncbi:MAG TPA: ComF family protein [Micropepsaceae bacterium]|nr:ComF family protein [Micropepsaceae bacterium]
MTADGEINRLKSNSVRRIGRALLDTFFPPLCMSCRKRVAEPHALCPSCWSAIAFIAGAVCSKCGTPFETDPGGETLCGPCHANPHSFDRARSLFKYDDASRGLILGLKHGDRLDHVPGLTRWLGRTGAELLNNADLIVPVPLHRMRLWKRRYNQAALLAEQLSRWSGKPHVPLLIQRTRPTPSQGEMTSAKARRRNVLGAFKVPPRFRTGVQGKKVLLVDDVFTTGATLDACARALKRAGAARVEVLTLARVVRPG